MKYEEVQWVYPTLVDNRVSQLGLLMRAEKAHRVIAIIDGGAGSDGKVPIQNPGELCEQTNNV